MSYKTLSSDKVSDIVNRTGIYMPTLIVVFRQVKK